MRGCAQCDKIGKYWDADISTLLMRIRIHLLNRSEGIKPQNDEDDMGVTYAELSVYGRLRKIARCGPVSMYQQCRQLWKDALTAAEVAIKVRKRTSVLLYCRAPRSD